MKDNHTVILTYCTGREHNRTYAIFNDCDYRMVNCAVRIVEIGFERT